METFTNENATAVADFNDTLQLCPSVAPGFIDYMTALTVDYIVAFSVLGVVTLAIVINFFEELVYLYRHTPSMSQSRDRDRAKWLLAIYPLTAFTTFVSLVAPRTTGFNDLVTAIYVAVCVYVFVVMIIDHFGGPIRMTDRLSGHVLRVNVPPFCFCCCCCCLNQPFNRVTVQILGALIMQFVLVRPFLGYVVSILVADGSFGIAEANYIGFAYSVSTLLAIWSFRILYDVCAVPLAGVHIRPKFICLQLVLVIVGVQRSIIEIFVLTGFIVCQPPMSATAVADRWNGMIKIGEITALAAVARLYYRHTIKVYNEHLEKQAPTASSSSTASAAACDRNRLSVTSNVNHV
jgi:organic solute transporter subunit alpha